MASSWIVLAALVSLVLADSGKLPDNITKCRRSDPNINECLKKSIQRAIPTFVPGVPKLGVFPLDPLKIEYLQVKQGTGPVAVDLQFREFYLKGIGKARLTDVVSDLDNYKLTVRGYIEKPIEVESDYELSGNVLILPIAGKGKCQLSLEDVKAELTLTGKGVKKGGKVYYDVENLNVSLDTNKLRMHFDNLVSENKALGDNINLFLNENWREIYEELYPVVRTALGEAFKAIITRVFSKVPMDEIFLP